MSASTIDTYIAQLAPALAAVADQLRDLLDGRLGSGLGTIWHGHPVWKDDRQPVAGFKAYGSHVTFMIWTEHGVDSVKLREPGDVDVAKFGELLERVTAK